MSAELARAFLAEGNGFYRLEDRKRVTEDIRQLATAYLTLQAENELVREALREAQCFDDESGNLYCPACKTFEQYGHEEGCLIGQALAKCSPGAVPVVTETPEKGANPHDD